MTFPTITAWLTIFLIVLVISFILKIAMVRRRERIELETAGSDELQRIVRSHGNLIETAPLFVILLAFLEMAGGHTLAVIILAVIFAISRLMHPVGLSGKDGTFKYRVYGVFITITAYILSSIYLAYMLIVM